MGESRAPLGSAWIVGPRYDLCFFSTLWLLPLLVFAPLAFEGVGLGAAFFYVWVYHLLIRLPHFAAMFRVTYFRPSQFAYYREHWIRYFAIPAAILAVYAAPLASPEGYDTGFGVAISMVAFIWGYQHIGMQNYGILQLYRIRTGSVGDRSGVRFERAILYSIIVAVALGNHGADLARSLGWNAIDATRALDVERSLGVVTALLFVGYFVHLRRRGGFSWPMVLYFAVAIVAMVRWPIYDRLPPGSWFLVFNGHHSVAYLGLLFLMEWNAKSTGSRLTFAAGVGAFARFHASLVVAALGLVAVTVIYATAKSRLPGGYDGASLEVLLGFFVMHYYVEALVWKFRRPHNRATTLPLLRHPSPA